MKLELKFDITEIFADRIEGTFDGHDKHGMTQMIASYAITQYIHQKFEWDNEKLGVRLFEENGSLIDGESMFGTFVAWREGVPA
mgnify:CR=1 FL=1|tara:strand:+ start:133 stop:384 length:252 start_codon:yes stop_codon:yes gene_type:complete